ncbi:MAG: hypothetical protein ACTSU2_09495 [Promethearchaeota archaeon]
MDKKGLAIFLVVIFSIGFLILGSISNNEDPYTVPEPPGTVIPKGNRLLGIDINDRADNNYDAGVKDAQKAHIDFTTLALGWDTIEPVPDTYFNNSEDNYINIANIYYPQHNLKLVLEINPIDTNHLRMPDDLKGKPFNCSEVINRFNSMIDWVLDNTENTTLVSLTIGNEVDIYLGDNLTLWEEYIQFFDAVYQHIHSYKRNETTNNLIIGVKATYNGLINNGIAGKELLKLNNISDSVMVTYYPSNANYQFEDPKLVSQDWAKLIGLYPNKTFMFLEVGYSSSLKLNSSENKQAQFVQQTFRAWDKYNETILAICFEWLYDISQTALNNYENYYGISDSNFLEYLGTIGLIHYDYKPKQAYSTLIAEAIARGW